MSILLRNRSQSALSRNEDPGQSCCASQFVQSEKKCSICKKLTGPVEISPRANGAANVVRPGPRPYVGRDSNIGEGPVAVFAEAVFCIARKGIAIIIVCEVHILVAIPIVVSPRDARPFVIRVSIATGPAAHAVAAARARGGGHVLEPGRSGLLEQKGHHHRTTCNIEEQRRERHFLCGYLTEATITLRFPHTSLLLFSCCNDVRSKHNDEFSPADLGSNAARFFWPVGGREAKDEGRAEIDPA